MDATESLQSSHPIYLESYPEEVSTSSRTELINPTRSNWSVAGNGLPNGEAGNTELESWIRSVHPLKTVVNPVCQLEQVNIQFKVAVLLSLSRKHFGPSNRIKLCDRDSD